MTEASYSQGIAQTFPLAAVWDAERGLALGIQPQMMVSDMRLGSDPVQGRMVFATVKRVIDPGETETAEFVAMAFEPTFGWQDALEAYYRAYPEWFAPREGTDPQLWGTGGYLRSDGSDLCLEEARRFAFGWDWGYAPYRFTGDWYAHEEYYDGEYGPLDEWHEKLRHEDEVEGRAAVALNYIIPQFVNVKLAEEHFPDAFLFDAQGNRTGRAGDFVKRDEIITGGWYWGNSIQEHSLQSLREIAEKRGAEGISFDNATGTGMRYGPGPSNSPGRAFTGGANGAVWAAEGINYGGHMDFVHTLSNGEHRLMVAANGPQCLLTCFRTDVAMHEASPYYGTERLQAMRRLCGHKPIVLWEDHPESDLKWEHQIYHYRGESDFLQRACCFVVKCEDTVVSGASSFVDSDRYAECQVTTAPQFRRKGYARAVSAAYIARCNELGKEVPWDAANEASVNLGRSLGYRDVTEYTVLELLP